MCSDIAVSVRNLTKTYRIFAHPGDRLKQAFTFGQVKFHKEFTALKNVSLEIKKGETIGIIGRNGSGKSTLLQLLCGILKPTSGTIGVNGRVSALLELGSGFNPEFTGRENVFFQGAIMGVSRKEMSARFSNIAAFADMGEFIDQPVRTYSNGMFIRLAFATAIHVEPDILIVDEALAVGDIAFQQKCLQFFSEFSRAGGTLLLVTHDTHLMRNLCDRSVYLSQGEVKLIAAPEAAAEAYLHDLFRYSRHGSRPNVLIQRDIVELDSQQGMIANVEAVPHSVCENEHLRVRIRAVIAPDVVSPEIVVQFRDARGYVLYGVASPSQVLQREQRGSVVEIAAELSVKVLLAPGEYAVSVALNDRFSSALATKLDKVVGAAIFDVISSGRQFHGCIDLDARWESSVLNQGRIDTAS